MRSFKTLNFHSGQWYDPADASVHANVSILPLRSDVQSYALITSCSDTEMKVLFLNLICVHEEENERKRGRAREREEYDWVNHLSLTVSHVGIYINMYSTQYIWYTKGILDI